jgi:hypothetical protein
MSIDATQPAAIFERMIFASKSPPGAEVVRSMLMLDFDP